MKRFHGGEEARRRSTASPASTSTKKSKAKKRDTTEIDKKLKENPSLYKGPSNWSFEELEIQAKRLKLDMDKQDDISRFIKKMGHYASPKCLPPLSYESVSLMQQQVRSSAKSRRLVNHAAELWNTIQKEGREIYTSITESEVNRICKKFDEKYETLPMLLDTKKLFSEFEAEGGQKLIENLEKEDAEFRADFRRYDPFGGKKSKRKSSRVASLKTLKQNPGQHGLKKDVTERFSDQSEVIDVQLEYDGKKKKVKAYKHGEDILFPCKDKNCRHDQVEPEKATAGNPNSCHNPRVDDGDSLITEFSSSQFPQEGVTVEEDDDTSPEIQKLKPLSNTSVSSTFSPRLSPLASQLPKPGRNYPKIPPLRLSSPFRKTPFSHFHPMNTIRPGILSRPGQTAVIPVALISTPPTLTRSSRRSKALMSTSPGNNFVNFTTYHSPSSRKILTQAISHAQAEAQKQHQILQAQNALSQDLQTEVMTDSVVVEVEGEAVFAPDDTIIEIVETDGGSPEIFTIENEGEDEEDDGNNLKIEEVYSNFAPKSPNSDVIVQSDAMEEIIILPNPSASVGAGAGDAKKSESGEENEDGEEIKTGGEGINEEESKKSEEEVNEASPGERKEAEKESGGSEIKEAHEEVNRDETVEAQEKGKVDEIVEPQHEGTVEEIVEAPEEIIEDEILKPKEKSKKDEATEVEQIVIETVEGGVQQMEVEQIVIETVEGGVQQMEVEVDEAVKEDENITVEKAEGTQEEKKAGEEESTPVEAQEEKKTDQNEENITSEVIKEGEKVEAQEDKKTDQNEENIISEVIKEVEKIEEAIQEDPADDDELEITEVGVNGAEENKIREIEDKEDASEDRGDQESESENQEGDESETEFSNPAPFNIATNIFEQADDENDDDDSDVPLIVSTMGNFTMPPPAASFEHSPPITDQEKDDAAAAAELRMRNEQLKLANDATNAKFPQKKPIAGVEHVICHLCSSHFPSSSVQFYRAHMKKQHDIEIEAHIVTPNRLEATGSAGEVKSVRGVPVAQPQKPFALPEPVRARRLSATMPMSAGMNATVDWYKCKACDQLMEKKDTVEHLATCCPNEGEDAFEIVPIGVWKPTAPPQLYCGFCEKHFEAKVGLRQHLTQNHKEYAPLMIMDPDFRCSCCLAKFRDTIHLSLHVQTCTNRRASSEVMLELAKGMLHCDVCLHPHKRIADTQECYTKKGLIRCILCLHTVVSRGNFFHHMKTYHFREAIGIRCPFCDIGETPIRECFVHIIESHYNPMLLYNKSASTNLTLDEERQKKLLQKTQSRTVQQRAPAAATSTATVPRLANPTPRLPSPAPRQTPPAQLPATVSSAQAAGPSRFTVKSPIGVGARPTPGLSLTRQSSPRLGTSTTPTLAGARQITPRAATPVTPTQAGMWKIIPSPITSTTPTQAGTRQVVPRSTTPTQAGIRQVAPRSTTPTQTGSSPRQILLPGQLQWRTPLTLASTGTRFTIQGGQAVRTGILNPAVTTGPSPSTTTTPGSQQRIITLRPDQIRQLRNSVGSKPVTASSQVIRIPQAQSVGKNPSKPVMGRLSLPAFNQYPASPRLIQPNTTLPQQRVITLAPRPPMQPRPTTSTVTTSTLTPLSAHRITLRPGQSVLGNGVIRSEFRPLFNPGTFRFKPIKPISPATVTGPLPPIRLSPAGKPRATTPQ